MHVFCTIKMQRVIPKLLTWYNENYRKLPWRETQNPYYIWVSEIILQQTRVDQGLLYYLRFIDKFPEIHDLAQAEEAEVLKIWQGLGYYARARNMQKAAKLIVNELNGVFPSSFSEIIKLPGVGSYTAAAIASFAFKIPYAAIDGNVKRVISRFLGIDIPINKAAFMNISQTFLNEQIPAGAPDLFNQAMIELGALICSPINPKCISCPLSEECTAARESKQNKFPVVAPKIKTSLWEINYALIEKNGKFLFVKRESTGIWGGLHEFPQIAENQNLKQDDFIVEFEHKLSHKNIIARLFKMHHNSDLVEGQLERFWVEIENVNFFPMHKLMLKFVDYLDWQ